MGNKKLFVGFILALLCGNAVDAATEAVKDCHVGADPWKLGRQVNSEKEKEYRLNESLEVVSLNSKGKPSSRCRLTANESTIVIPNGFDPSVDHPGLPVDQLPWIKGCGNPIVSKFTLTDPPAPVAGRVVVATVGTQCHDGDRSGTYQIINGQLACLLDGVTQLPVRYTEERQYHPSVSEVTYDDRRVVRRARNQFCPAHYDSLGMLIPEGFRHDIRTNGICRCGSPGC